MELLGHRVSKAVSDNKLPDNNGFSKQKRISLSGKILSLQVSNPGFRQRVNPSTSVATPRRAASTSSHPLSRQ